MRKIRFVYAAVLLAILLVSGGCSASEPEKPVKLFSEVYNDGVTAIETGRLIRLPGSTENHEYCFLELRLTNNGTAPIYYSSMLCLAVSSGGQSFSNENILDASLAARENITGFISLDGVIEPSTTVQGFIFFEAPLGTEQFDIRLATDFSEDQWVSFSCAVN